MHLLQRFITLYLSMLCILVWPAGLFAQSFKPEALRTSFLYHIAHYTIYPDNRLPINNFHFCFLESDTQAHSNLFEELPRKQVKSRNIRLIRLSGEDDEFLEQCQLLFISKDSESKALFETLAQLNRTVVSVGETRGFVENGGMITIVPLQSKMKIFISRAEFENTTLKFSSLLLKRANFR